jgi:hypothetical protein
MLDSCEKSCNNCGAELPTGSPTPVEDSGSESNASAPTLAPTNITCIDETIACAGWAADDQCSNNPGYMLENCKLSCNICQSEGEAREGDDQAP